MELVVAEKPSVARDLARVLGVRASGQDAFEGRDHVITWCIGHLVELDEPAAYDAAWKSWRLDALPMLPRPFQLRASKHAAGHLRAVRALLRDKRFSSVIDACDAGREGELIFRYVYQYAGARLPVRRLWISSMTDEAIRRGLATLRPGAQLDPLADAARSRSEADWLVGMNATRAVTVRNREGGHTALYSIGRVQTPTLAMIVARELEIRAFKPRDYWEVRAQLRTEDGGEFVAQWRGAVEAGPLNYAKLEVTRLGSAALASDLIARDRAAPGPVVENVKAKVVKEPPPLLFDLTSLQRTANRRFGFTATQTLEIAQALYERHKILTYPRTDSRHLSNDLVGTLPELFRSLAAVPEYAAFVPAEVPRPSRRVFDDSKVHDHHAIIPTGAAVHLGSLGHDERRLFDLVVRRFLGAFHADAEFAVTEAWIRVDASGAGAAKAQAGEPVILDALPAPPDRYFARGRVRTEAGWQAVAGIDERTAVANSQNGEAEPVALLPRLVEGQVLSGTFGSRAKQTTPPPRYTEATLLGAMESAGRHMDDETLRAAMRDSGLGTPATRAAIIETLLRREYIYRERQHLVPTETGTGLIQALPVASLASPELTGNWEARLARIARGEDTRAAFMADIETYVTDLVDAIRGSTPAPPPGNQPEASFGRGRGKWKKKRGKRGREPVPTTRPNPGRDERKGPHVGREVKAAPHVGREMRSNPGRDERNSAQLTPHVGHEIKTTLHVGHEIKATPHVGREIKATPHVGREIDATPHVGGEIKATPHVGREIRPNPGRDERKSAPLTPHVGREIDATPHVGREIKATPHVGREIKATPHVGREIRPNPGRDERKSAPLTPHVGRANLSIVPRDSRIDFHQDEAIIAALRASATAARTPPILELVPPEPAPLTCPRCRLGTLLTGSRGWAARAGARVVDS